MQSRIDPNAINARADLRALVEAAGGQLDKFDRCACPIHGGQNQSAFHIYRAPDGIDRWKCFSECGGGDAIDFVKRTRGVSFVEACAIITGGKVEFEPEELAKIAQERERRAAVELAEAARKYEQAVHDLRDANDYLAWHESMPEAARQLWRDRGVNDTWQSMYRFGYCAAGHYAAPALTIPVWKPADGLQSVRMRLLSPSNPKDKYRPVREGLKAANFYADPTLPVIAADWVLVVEGEIKAAAVMCAIDPDNDPQGLVQIVGVPGKENKRLMGELAGELKGQRVFVALDPDATPQAVEFARLCGGAHVLRLPAKIDDYMLAHTLGREWMEDVLKMTKWVK